MQSLDTTRFVPLLWTNNPQLHQAAIDSGIHSELSVFQVLFGWKSQRASLIRFVTLLRQATAMVKKHRIGLIHVNSGAPCQWMWLVARMNHIPMLTQLHSGYLLRDRIRLCLHLSPHLVTVSRAISENLLAEGFPEQRLSIVHNGIDIETLEKQPPKSVKQMLHLPHESYLIATVGSLIHRKGVDRLLHAVATLANRQPHLYLLVIGDGDEQPALQALAAKLNIRDRVFFVGEQPDVFGWLRKDVDLFISGAREEAFGLVIAEAALAGLPIIAPAVGGIPEVVEHQISALLYPSYQDELIPAYINTLMQSPTLAQRLATAASQSVRRRFALHTNTQQLESLYQRLLDERLPDNQQFDKRSPHRAPGLLTWFNPLRQLRGARSGGRGGEEQHG
jgi:glycosyltransferase involved in cell wall biosynthesis